MRGWLILLLVLCAACAPTGKSAGDVGGDQMISFLQTKYALAQSFRYGSPFFTDSFLESDSAPEGGGYFTAFSFTGEGGQKAEIAVEGLKNGAINLTLPGRWSVHDGGSGRGSNALLRVVLPEDGTYYLLVGSAEVGAFNVYTGEIPPHVALPPRWELLYKNHESELYIDRDTIDTELVGTTLIKRMVSYTAYNEPRDSDGERYDGRLLKWEANCRTRTLALQYVQDIFRDVRLSSTEFPDGEEKRVASGSLGEMLWNAVCAH